MSAQADQGMHDAATAAEVRRLADLEAIRRLKYEYFEAADALPQGSREEAADRFARCFTEDARGDYGSLGTAEGREGIRRWVLSATGAAVLTIHCGQNPIIDVDGDRATGRWCLMGFAIFRGQEAKGLQPLLGRYEDEYVRTAEGWKIQVCRFSLLTPLPPG